MTDRPPEFSTERPVAIVGAGVMGTKVAWACARAGIETRLFDIEPGKAADSVARALTWSDGAEQDTVRAHLDACADLDDALAGVQLAFENVPEDLALKQRVLADVASRLTGDACLGSNASALTVSPLAGSTGMADRFFCLNFTDPRTSTLVELMTGEDTARQTAQFALDWSAAIGMVPIHTRKEQLGYSFNRLWRVIKKEVLRQIAEGVILPEEIDKAWMMTFNTPYGPCGLMDEISLRSVQKVETIYFEDSGDPSDAPPAFLGEMIARGEEGVLTGKGFYEYPNPAYRDPDFLKSGSVLDPEES
jgi:3-hydroxybutyryl-CoA dehydrogenase